MTKNQIKYYSLLKEKKYREAERKFLVEGYKLVKEALESGYSCELVLLTKEFSLKNGPVISEFLSGGLLIEEVSGKDIEKISDTKSPQGLIGVFHLKNSSEINFDDNLIVGLEEINDPGNLGAIIRSADWFGVSSIILSRNCAELYNPKTIRASAGSVFHLNFLIADNFINKLKELQESNHQILCADLTGKNLFELAQNAKRVVVFANEANGPSEDLKNIADQRITIPRKGKAESLNVSNASAVIIAELSK
jgi:RNA methyltransferase, TrmH family